MGGCTLRARAARTSASRPRLRLPALATSLFAALDLVPRRVICALERTGVRAGGVRWLLAPVLLGREEGLAVLVEGVRTERWIRVLPDTSLLELGVEAWLRLRLVLGLGR